MLQAIPILTVPMPCPGRLEAVEILETSTLLRHKSVYVKDPRATMISVSE